MQMAEKEEADMQQPNIIKRFFQRANAFIGEYDDQYGYLTMKAKDPVKYGTLLLTGVGVLQTFVSFNLHRAIEQNNTVKMNKLAAYQRITAFTFLFGAGILAYRCYLLYKSIPQEVLQERIALQRESSRYELQQRAEASQQRRKKINF